jgi:hypothetical protein
MGSIAETIPWNHERHESKSPIHSHSQTPHQVQDSEPSEYSDPDLTDSADYSDDPPSPTTEDLIFRRSLALESEIPRSTAKILEIQQDFSAQRRELAVHRIIELNYYFQLSSDALYNAVCYFDIVLSNVPVVPDDYELTASVCYWLSSKVDTHHQLTVEQINGAIGTEFAIESFKATELTILKALGFQLSFPTAKMFMRRILAKSSATNDVFHVSNLLVEVALMKFKFVDVPPSVIAVAAIAVTWAGVRDLEAARSVIQECSFREIARLTDSMRTMVAYAERFVAGRGAADAGGIRALMDTMEFKFDIDSLVC